MSFMTAILLTDFTCFNYEITLYRVRFISSYPLKSGAEPLFTYYDFSYVFKKSSLEIPDWVQIVLKVEALMNGWFGIVSGVLVPSEFILSIDMCSRSLTI